MTVDDRRPFVVNLMPHGPAYDFAPDEKPDVTWATARGDRVGFWAREWPDLLGEAVLRAGGRYRWEVWQPDERCDREYAATLPSGVVHRLLPATAARARPGLRPVPSLHSAAILARLESLEPPAVLLLHGFRVPFYLEVLERLGPWRRWPIVVVGHGVCTTPVSELAGLHRPLTYVDIVLEERRLRRALRSVDAVTVPSAHATRQVRRSHGGRIERLTMGCDCDFWSPAPDASARRAARGRLGVGDGVRVFLATGNFVPLKQFDRLIDAFARLYMRDDWALVIAGHGPAPERARLQRLMRPLAEAGRGVLHPYATDERLRDLYWAADAYVTVSWAEGASVAVMKAMACGLPVLSTPVGETAERMRAAGVGAFVPLREWDAWPAAIARLLDHGLPRRLPLAAVRDAYDWPGVAATVMRLCDDLVVSDRAARVP